MHKVRNLVLFINFLRMSEPCVMRYMVKDHSFPCSVPSVLLLQMLMGYLFMRLLKENGGYDNLK